MRSFLVGLFYLGCTFGIMSAFGSPLSDSTLKNKYSYNFTVQPVKSCPGNRPDWEAAAKRAGCNDTRGYHCVPDKFHETLIEFCYFKERNYITKGNCLELAAYGILNNVNCQDFSAGCPQESYYSNEIYTYPVCLSLAFRCFTSDVKCLHQKLREQPIGESDLGPVPPPIDCAGQMPLTFTFLAPILVVQYCICVFLYRQYKNTLKRPPVSEKQAQMDDMNILKNFESELMLDNIHLSMLIRRHCRDGAFKNFEYLLKKRILKKKDDANLQQILTSHDENGYTLLHCAAMGGSVKIFKAIMNAGAQIKIHETTYDGLTVLHIACKNKNFFLCRFLMFEKNFKTLLLNKKSTKGWNAAHYAAEVGSIEILNLLEGHGLDIAVATENKLNILDIACLHNQADLFEVLINRDDLCLPLENGDGNGWTIAHVAARVGNNDIFECLIKKNVNIELKTKQKKTVLHISCEYGNYGICMKILQDYKTIVYDKDDEDWNALHYAAKGGNLKVYKTVEKLFHEQTCEIIRDGRTVLHIACINNSTEICQYICNNSLYADIINSKGEGKDWTAAHYVAVEKKEDGAEKELIRILVQSGIDLQAITKDGLTVLGIACEHRNRYLINYLLKNHNELLGVGIPYLKNAAKDSNDKRIESQIAEALENYNGKIVDVKVQTKMV